MSRRATSSTLRRVDRVLIENVTLDGNQSKLIVGGEWGDSGRQCHASGIVLDYVNDALLKDVVCRDHALDGITILQGHPAVGDPPFSPEGPPTPHRLVRVQCLRNGRQGFPGAADGGSSAKTASSARPGEGRFPQAPGPGSTWNPKAAPAATPASPAAASPTTPGRG